MCGAEAPGSVRITYLTSFHLTSADLVSSEAVMGRRHDKLGGPLHGARLAQFDAAAPDHGALKFR